VIGRSLPVTALPRYQPSAKVVTVGEYYKLRARSARATYGGIGCSLIGTAAIVAAFSWPVF
jgi:hypothetical protein